MASKEWHEITHPFPDFNGAIIPDIKVHGVNMGHHLGPVGPRWAPVGPMNLAIRDIHVSSVEFNTLGVEFNPSCAGRRYVITAPADVLTF